MVMHIDIRKSRALRCGTHSTVVSTETPIDSNWSVLKCIWGFEISMDVTIVTIENNMAFSMFKTPLFISV